MRPSTDGNVFNFGAYQSSISCKNVHDPRLITCMMQNRNYEDSIDSIGTSASLTCCVPCAINKDQYKTSSFVYFQLPPRAIHYNNKPKPWLESVKPCHVLVRVPSEEYVSYCSYASDHASRLSQISRSKIRPCKVSTNCTRHLVMLSRFPALR
jgi:hypothetical protein